MAKFLTNASGATWWPNFFLIQVTPPGGWISNKCMWYHLFMFTKFASYKVPPVMVSTHGSVVPLAMFMYVQTYWTYKLTLTYGWNCPGRIFSPNIVTFFATLTPVFKHFLHWFYCFYYFYGSITCARVGKTKFLTRHFRLGTWKKPLNMDNFEVFSHFFPFCISSYKP